MDWLKSVRTITALAIFVVLCLFPIYAESLAENPSIGEILVTNTSNQLIFFSYLTDGFTVAVNQRLESGLPIIFTYYVELRRKRPLWINSRVARKVLTRQVKYDPLKKEYIQVNSDGEQNEKRVTKDYREMQRWITFLDGVELIDYGRLKPGRKYYVRIKAKIKHLKAPFPVKYLKIFFPFLDQDTSWQESSLFIIKK